MVDAYPYSLGRVNAKGILDEFDGGLWNGCEVG